MEEPPSGNVLPPLQSPEFPPLPSSTPKQPLVHLSPTQPSDLAAISHPPVAPSSAACNPSPSPPSSLWSELFQRASRTLRPFPPPSFNQNGVPIVKAPSSILLQNSKSLKDFLICHFFGEPPSIKKIFSDLNPIWGKNGSIQVRYYTPRSCLILIPNQKTRKWVLDTGFWSAGMVAFSVSIWSPTASLAEQTLTSAPVWLELLRVPPQLWSFEGFSLIASGVGVPLPPAKDDQTSVGSFSSSKIRAIVPLNKGPLPTSVIVEDSEGVQVTIDIRYPSLPPLCASCNHYGHLPRRCHLRSSASSSRTSPKASDPSHPVAPASVPPPETSPPVAPASAPALPSAASDDLHPCLPPGDASLGFLSGPSFSEPEPSSLPLAQSKPQLSPSLISLGRILSPSPLKSPKNFGPSDINLRPISSPFGSKNPKQNPSSIIPTQPFSAQDSWPIPPAQPASPPLPSILGPKPTEIPKPVEAPSSPDHSPLPPPCVPPEATLSSPEPPPSPLVASPSPTAALLHGSPSFSSSFPAGAPPSIPPSSPLRLSSSPATGCPASPLPAAPPADSSDAPSELLPAASFTSLLMKQIGDNGKLPLSPPRPRLPPQRRSSSASSLIPSLEDPVNDFAESFPEELDRLSILDTEASDSYLATASDHVSLSSAPSQSSKKKKKKTGKKAPKKPREHPLFLSLSKRYL